jgi:hypothetical protein
MAVFWNLPFRASTMQTFTTDSRGFRNRREMEQADIVLIGDSYIEGHYVSDEQTCAEVLDRLTGLSVANLGVAGYGSLQELEVLQHYALSLNPRLVAWFFFEGNDLYDDQHSENAMIHIREHDIKEIDGYELNKTKTFDFNRRKFLGASFTRMTAQFCYT